ncbi:MAG: hypothetical protein L6276_08110, partial [Acetobacterium sp.]|nr:hypothetical protein [Acetobacterium sp.]
MKTPCNKCGKTIGFFDRNYKIDNEKLKIKYDVLCGDCNGVLKKGVEKLDDMYQWMMNNLKKNKDVQKNGMVSVEADLLILLAVEALFSVAPDYYHLDSPLNQTFIRAKESRGVDRQRDIVRIVHILLMYGFEANLKEQGLDSTRNFIAYMIQNEQFLEEVEVNCGVEDELVKANVFLSRRGLIIDTLDNPKLIYISIPSDLLVDYQVESSEIINEVILKNVFYPWDKKKNVVLTLV